jgi:hypothetical protein
MAGNQNSGRKPKPNAKRTSILIDAPTVMALRYITDKEGVSQSRVVEKAVEEYFLRHYEAELEKLISE